MFAWARTKGYPWASRMKFEFEPWEPGLRAMRHLERAD
jgi:hypothetical protein